MAKISWQLPSKIYQKYQISKNDKSHTYTSFSDPETHLFDSDRSDFLFTDTSEYVNESRGDRKFILNEEKI